MRYTGIVESQVHLFGGTNEQNLNRDHERLGITYQLKLEATAGTDRVKNIAATNMLAQLLYDNFQVLPDHYLTLQLESILSMVNTIGGVEITLPKSITTEHKITFPAGTQVLDGRLSAEFLRSTRPGGEPARLKRQNLYLAALRTKVLHPNILSKAPQLFQQFNEALITDLSPNQFATLSCAMERISQDRITFYEIDGELVIKQKDGALLPVWDKIKPVLEEALGR